MMSPGIWMRFKTRAFGFLLYTHSKMSCITVSMLSVCLRSDGMDSARLCLTRFMGPWPESKMIDLAPQHTRILRIGTAQKGVPPKAETLNPNSMRALF